MALATCQVSRTLLAAPAVQPTAVLDSYAETGGQGYFALKLTPPVPQPPNQAHDVVVLVDTSASQIGAYRDRALGVVRAMFDSFSASDRVALIAVDVQAVRLTNSLVPPRDSSMVQALAALERRVPLGSTDMPAALRAALAALPAKRDPARARSVVYVGDGFSIASLVPVDLLSRLEGEYADRRVSFTSYAIGPRLNAELLGALSNHTGGMLIPDMEGAADRQVGSYLATVARGAVIWPASVVFPPALQDTYPAKTPPLRFDRDSVIIGTLDQQSIKSGDVWQIEMQGELAGKPVKLSWQPKAPQPAAENAYLAKIVQWAAMTGGVTLPTAGSATLGDMRRWATYGAQQLARLGEKALAVGSAKDAARLASEAERLDPANAEADHVRGAAARARQSTAADLRMAGTVSVSPRPTRETETVDGDALDEIERQQRIVQGFLWAEVNDALNQANGAMSVDPDGTRDQLKLLLDKVQHTAEVEPDARRQMLDRIESGLRQASHMSTAKVEQDLRRQQAEAAAEAKDRLNRALLLDEQKVDQLMSRFNALMDQERYRDAEALADVAEEMRPSTPGLRNAELTARTVGHTADILAAREARHKGGFDMLLGVEQSSIPMPDDPPIVYPDPAVWQMVTERRKKFRAVDLTDPKPSEAKILAALDEPTDVDFNEQPLSDVVDYLKQRHGIEIQLDKKALTDAGVGSEVPITRTIKDITLRSALKLLLGEFDMTYVLRNEVLLITSKTEAENMLSTHVYPVADLVVKITPPRSMMGPAAGGMGGGFLGGMPGMMGGTGMNGMGMGGMGMGGMGMGMGGMGMGMGGMGGMGLGGGMGFF